MEGEGEKRKKGEREEGIEGLLFSVRNRCLEEVIQSFSHLDQKLRLMVT